MVLPPQADQGVSSCRKCGARWATVPCQLPHALACGMSWNRPLAKAAAGGPSFPLRCQSASRCTYSSRLSLLWGVIAGVGIWVTCMWVGLQIFCLTTKSLDRGARRPHPPAGCSDESRTRPTTPPAWPVMRTTRGAANSRDGHVPPAGQQLVPHGAAEHVRFCAEGQAQVRHVALVALDLAGVATVQGGDRVGGLLYQYLHLWWLE